MTSNASERRTDAPIDADQVEQFLREHPGFLRDRPELLAALDVPHRTGDGAVSLIERQVEALRASNRRLEARLGELLRTARDNERVGARLLALGRALLEADSLDATLATVREMLLTEFTADEVAIRLIDTEAGERAAAEPERFTTQGDPALELFSDILASGRAVCGSVTAEQRDVLFKGLAESIGSCAVVPLRTGRPLGLIGLGSHDPAHFSAQAGTLFLDQLGELVSSGVARYVDHA